jgi:hypothetical protein
MIQIKVKDEWISVDVMRCFYNANTRGIYRDSEIQDIRLKESEPSYLELADKYAKLLVKDGEKNVEQGEQKERQYVQLPTVERRLRVIEQALYIMPKGNEETGELEFESAVLASFSQAIERNFNASEQMWNNLRNATHDSIEAISEAFKKQNEVIEDLQKQIYELRSR